MTKTLTGPGPTEAEREIDYDAEFFSMVGTGVAPPCEIPTGCEEVAKWSATLVCCGQLILICETHMDLLLERIAAWVKAGNRFGCPWCGNEITAGKIFQKVERI